MIQKMLPQKKYTCHNTWVRKIILITGIYVESLSIVPDNYAINNGFLYQQACQKIFGRLG